MVLLVYTNRATEEVQLFNDSTNSALHDSEPLRHRDQACVEERLASIPAWKDPRTCRKIRREAIPPEALSPGKEAKFVK